jgi:hypothetical protein
MAIINLSRKFVFVHVPKAAGTSVSNFLSKYTTYRDLEVGGTPYEGKIGSYYWRFGLGKHSTAREIRSVMGIDAWSTMFTFAFVRHPVPRTYSIFRFLKFRYRDWENSSSMDSIESFEDFLRSDLFATSGPDRIFNPQCFWFTSGQEFMVDVIGRLENLDADMSRIVTRIEGRSAAFEMAKKNASPPGDPSAVTETALQIISNRYAEDFERLGYECARESFEVSD